MRARTWKRAQTEAAKIIGGRRVWQKFSAGDAESERFVADAKKRRTCSQREMRDDLERLACHSETRARAPLLVLVDAPGRGHRARAPRGDGAESLMDWLRDAQNPRRPPRAARPRTGTRVARGLALLAGTSEVVGAQRRARVEDDRDRTLARCHLEPLHTVRR